MRRMMWAPVLAALLLACGTAWAAPVTVNLRVEGAASTIFEAPVTTDGKVITRGGNTLTCDGTTNPGNPGPGPTATSALDDGSVAGGFSWDATFGGDFFISSIAGEASNATQSWGIALNHRPLDVGGCQQQVAAGDDVLFAFDFFGGAPDYAERPLLSLSGPPRAATGQPVSLFVEETFLKAPYPAPREFLKGPAAGVTVGNAVTDPDGAATTTFATAGLIRLKAERPGSIRSNAVLICVSDTGTEDCGVPAAQLGTPVARNDVTDSSAPVARISGPRNGRKYRRGPRLLRGTARDEGSGVREVKLSIRRHARGKACQWWSGRRDRFVGRNCRKTFFFAIGDDANWSYLLPRPLGPGRYVVDVKVFDARRNRNDRFIPGENRTVFEVLRRTRGQSGRSAAAAARVKAMVIGRQGVIVDPLTVRAGKAAVRASGRTCAVAASTPLGALQAALRRERIGYAVRDYGSCARRNTRSSGQLFVTRIAGERNRGSDGWVYKIDDRTPGTGAADARLRTGDRLLWLYCKQDRESGGCQRSLRVVPAKQSGPAGGQLPVRVFGYDDRGARQAVPGARIALTGGNGEPVSAVSSADGAAVLTLPPAGLYRLSASAAGVAPSFPVTVRVRAR